MAGRRNRTPVRRHRIDALQVRPDARFGSATQHMQAAAFGTTWAQAAGQVQGHPVAGQQHRPQTAIVGLARRQAEGHLQQGRRRVPQAHRMPLDSLRPGSGIARLFLGRQDQAGTGAEAAEQVEDRQIEVQRGDRQQAIRCVHPQQVEQRVDGIDRRRVADLDALGHPGGARGVDHIGTRLRRQRHGAASAGPRSRRWTSRRGGKACGSSSSVIARHTPAASSIRRRRAGGWSMSSGT